MRILIVYATNSSGTLNASELVRDVCLRHHHTVELKRADTVTEADLPGHDLLIFGSCTWEKVEGKEHLDGQIQQHFQQFIEKMAGTKLPGQKIAVFALGDSGYRQFAAAADILKGLVHTMEATLVGEALKLDRYYFEYKENRPKVEAWAEQILKEAV